MNRLVLPLAVLALAAPISVGSTVHAQRPADWDPLQVYMTRESLEDLLTRLEDAAQSPAYSQSLRDRALEEAALIRVRLDQGDMQVGDRIELVVENDPALTDTFVVQQGRRLVVPDIGEVSLAGLLRAELEPFMAEYLSRFLRQPRVQARSLIPVTILGGVGRPGFYAVPSDALLTDALMAAGGPSSLAEITKIRVERSGDRIWDGNRLQQAITEGRTLDQLNLQAGDRIIVPQPSQFGSQRFETLRTLMLFVSLPFTLLGLRRLF